MCPPSFSFNDASSFFWTSLSITGIVTSLLAFGLLHLDGVHGLAGWRSVHSSDRFHSSHSAESVDRWLFLIEGLITLVVGLAAFFLMPASAVQTKTWFRPNGWFTDRETAIVVNRVLRDDPSKGASPDVAKPAAPLLKGAQVTCTIEWPSRHEGCGMQFPTMIYGL